jgi:RNA polymerase sigma factor (sigma-70 family)
MLIPARIIEGCRNGDKSAQNELYDLCKTILYGVCVRYIGKSDAAEDVFVEGMFKILTRCNDYTGSGSFMGWMRKVMVNECLMFLRKEKIKHLESLDSEEVKELSEDNHIEQKMTTEKMLELFELLPTGYRTVLNLYAIEGYKHKEIAEMLDISINTSKSQLILARKKFSELMEQYL